MEQYFILGIISVIIGLVLLILSPLVFKNDTATYLGSILLLGSGLIILFIHKKTKDSH